MRELGATRDDAAGEAFDKVAKLLGLGYPGGPAIDRLAVGGDASRLELVAPMAHSGTLEFSFSGIKTQVARWVAENGTVRDEQQTADVCASFQRAVTTVLASKLVAAAEREKVCARSCSAAGSRRTASCGTGPSSWPRHEASLPSSPRWRTAPTTPR